MTINRFFLAILWLALVIFAFGFAPPSDPQTVNLIKNLSIGQWQGINPVIIALFNLMGVRPWFTELCFWEMAIAKGKK